MPVKEDFEGEAGFSVMAYSSKTLTLSCISGGIEAETDIMGGYDTAARVFVCLSVPVCSLGFLSFFPLDRGLLQSCSIFCVCII